MAAESRYDRNVALFGSRGQTLVGSTHVVIIGLGGVGAHLAQQLAYLGVERLTLVDHDAVSVSNLNRLVGATTSDVGRRKVDVARRMIEAIQPGAAVVTVPERAGDLLSSGENSLAAVDIVMGAVDSDPVRVEILSRTASAGLPYLDCATDVLTEDQKVAEYGGRVVFSFVQGGCLSCLDVLDQRELRRATMSEKELAADEAIYGVPQSVLSVRGPSVVSLNGVIASLAVTEFIAWRVGLRPPQRLLTYVAHAGGVRPSRDEPPAGCPYCASYIARATP